MKNIHCSMDEKLSILTELIKLAKSDAEVKLEDYDFLQVIAKQLDVSDSEFNKLFNQYIDFAPPKLEFDRIIQFHCFILLMNIDKEISREELRFIKDIGIRMGLNPLATNKVLEIMNQYPNNIVPPNVLIEIFTQFYN